MTGNGSKPSRVIKEARLPNFKCKCGHQRTIPTDSELEKLLTTSCCPRCRCLDLDVTARLDGFNQCICRRCHLSFLLRADQSQPITVARDDAKCRSHQDHVAGIGLEKNAETLEPLRGLVRRIVLSGFNIEVAAFEHIKEMKDVDVGAIGDAILAYLKRRPVPAGIITKQVLMEALSFMRSGFSERP